MATSRAPDVVLAGSATTLLRWVTAQGVEPLDISAEFLEQPSYHSAQTLVSGLDKLVHVFIAAAESMDIAQADVLEAVLHSELPSIITAGWVRGPDTIGDDLALALAAKLRTWVLDCQAAGQVTPSLLVRELRPIRGGMQVFLPADAITYLAVAEFDQFAAERRATSYSARLARIQTSLGLRASELARVLAVSREAIRQWFDGAPISPSRWADIDQLDRVVQKLGSYFRAEALPAVIRRRVPGLENKTPLELLVAGRGDDLLSFYETIFERGVTQ